MVENLGFMIEKVQNGNNIYEYTAETFYSGVVVVEFEVDNELLDSCGNHIGFFGISFAYRRIAYYLFDNIAILD